MKKLIKDKLTNLGIQSESYHIPYTKTDLPRWGITLDGPRGSMVIEHMTDVYGGRPRYYLLRERGGSKEDALADYRTQREAIRHYLGHCYNTPF